MTERREPRNVVLWGALAFALTSCAACVALDVETLDATLECANCCAATACACGQAAPTIAAESANLCATTIGCCAASPVICAGASGCVVGACTRCAEGPDEAPADESARNEVPTPRAVARSDVERSEMPY